MFAFEVFSSSDVEASAMQPTARLNELLESLWLGAFSCSVAMGQQSVCWMQAVSYSIGLTAF